MDLWKPIFKPRLYNTQPKTAAKMGVADHAPSHLFLVPLVLGQGLRTLLTELHLHTLSKIGLGLQLLLKVRNDVLVVVSVRRKLAHPVDGNDP